MGIRHIFADNENRTLVVDLIAQRWFGGPVPKIVIIHIDKEIADSGGDDSVVIQYLVRLRLPDGSNRTE
jgi:hypothetical protein